MGLSRRQQVILIISLIIAAVFCTWFFLIRNGDQIKYRTSQVKKGDLDATISATGTIEPEELVDVGAQVAGKIVSFGKDSAGKLIDYGSAVEVGMVLAQIDDSLYRHDRDQAKASFEQAKADILVAEAELEQAKTKLKQTERDWKRTERAGGKDVISETDRDAALAAYETARAGHSIASAKVVQSRKAMAKAESVFKKAQQNLDYCTIVSPVSGVIIDRRVNIGQTVVSSMSAPSLFLIAKDLKKLQIWVAVNEADIGFIRERQPVMFTVDARPGETLSGETGKIRLNAAMTQNVVTYTVEVNIDNSDGKLLPYLSANVRFLHESRKNVLQVPNASLRWTPSEESIAKESGKGSKKGQDKNKADKKSPDSKDKQTKTDTEKASHVVWVKDGKKLRAINVKIGLTDGSYTEVSGEDIKEGLEVITGEEVADNGGNGNQAGSPFTPKFGRRPR